MLDPFYAARIREFWGRWKNQIRWAIRSAAIVLFFFILYRLDAPLQTRVDTPSIFASYSIFLLALFGIFYILGRFIGFVLRLPQQYCWKAGVALAMSVVLHWLVISALGLDKMQPIKDSLVQMGFWQGWVNASVFLLKCSLVIPIFGAVYYWIFNLPIRSYWIRYQIFPMIGIIGILLLMQSLFIEQWDFPEWITPLVAGPSLLYLFIAPLFYYFVHRELLWMQEQVQLPVQKWALAGLVLGFGLLLPFSFQAADQARYEWKTIYFDAPLIYPVVLDKSFEEYIVLPEKDVSIAHAAILGAKEVDPTVDVEECLHNFDRLAKEVHAELNFRENPKVSIGKMQARIFQSVGDSSNSAWLSYLKPYGLHVYNEYGFCMAGTLLHLGVAERIGLIVQQVMLYSADHTLLYYNDPVRSFYFEGNARNAFYDHLSTWSQKRCQEVQYRHLNRKEIFAAILYQLQHRSHDSLLYIARSAALDPDSPSTNTSISSCLLNHGDKEGALCKLNQVLDAIPDYFPALDQKINFVLIDPEQNFDSFMGRLTSIEDNAEVYCFWGLVAEGQGNREAAAKRYRKALWLDSDNTKAAFQLGRILYDQGRVNECLKVLERCSEAEKNPEILHLMSMVHQRKAQIQCRESLRINPFYFPAFLDLFLNLPPQEAADQYKVPYKLLGPSLWVYWNYFLPLSPFMHEEKTEGKCIE